MTRIETNATYIPQMRMLFPMAGTLMSVGLDEPVYGIQESYARNREGVTDHRYQVLLMPRGDVLSGFWTDLGPAEKFLMDIGGERELAPPYYQPVLGEHSVAECLEMADVGRMDDFAMQLLQRDIAESTLFADYLRLIEEDLAVVRNRSMFGPGGVTHRNGYSAVGAREQSRRISEGTFRGHN